MYLSKGHKMKVTGRCHCGELAFNAIVDPEKTMICHCTDCQVLSATAFRTVVAVSYTHLTLPTTPYV